MWDPKNPHHLYLIFVNLVTSFWCHPNNYISIPTGDTGIPWNTYLRKVQVGFLIHSLLNSTIIPKNLGHLRGRMGFLVSVRPPSLVARGRTQADIVIIVYCHGESSLCRCSILHTLVLLCPFVALHGLAAAGEAQPERAFHGVSEEAVESVGAQNCRMHMDNQSTASSSRISVVSHKNPNMNEPSHVCTCMHKS